MPWNPAIVAVVEVPTYGEPVGDPPVAPVTGYEEGLHLNIPASFVTPAMEDFLVEPETPVAVIAGAATAYLLFEDEAEAREICPHLWLEA